MAEETRTPAGESNLESGPFLAKIVGHLDPSYMGILEVQLLREVGNDAKEEGQLHHVKYMSPFYGVTGAEFRGSSPDNYDNTQKSYGMWMIPPDVGTLVVVMFIQGDPKKGYWIGCVQDDNMNFMVPGYAATQYVTEESKDQKYDSGYERFPVGEYNKLATETVQDSTKFNKPAHPLKDVFRRQGLMQDDIRGLTTSSARREVPSMVFGISTPGPVDKRDGRPTGKVGKKGSEVNAFVSRLGGSSFVMDDGDDKFLRTGPASSSPMEYVSVEQGGQGGDPTIPHNELIRLRTRTGHQILLHNSEDLIYIGNAGGTTWIELTSNGKIDIFALDSISIRTQQDLNFRADRDINLEAGRHINMKSVEEMQIECTTNYNLIVNKDQKIKVQGTKDETVTGAVKLTANDTLDVKVGGDTNITSGTEFNLHTGGNNNLTAGRDTHINTGGNHYETATLIHMNGPSASQASQAATAEIPLPLTLHNLPGIAGSIMRRVPTQEPYPHHENLSPEDVRYNKTDRDAAPGYSRFASKPANTSDLSTPLPGFKEYSTRTDTFAKLGEPNQG